MSRYKLIVSPEAETDISNAYQWYEDSAPGLGGDFLRCVEARFSLILRTPEIFQIIYKDLRRCVLRRFPYQIFFNIIGNDISIVAVFHAKRNPTIWKKRNQ